jgi:flavin-dependent dehydrogenase
MLDRVRSLPMLSGRLDLARWRTAQTGYCAAHGASLAPFAGSDWIALGDAALAFDPLAAQGLFNALYTGLAAAEAVHHALDDAPNAFIDYAAEMGRIRRAYLDHRQAWYGLETRWSSNPFWRRRLR